MNKELNEEERCLICNALFQYTQEQYKVVSLAAKGCADYSTDHNKGKLSEAIIKLNNIIELNKRFENK